MNNKRIVSEETKAKISAKRKLQIPPMLGRKHSPETILKIKASAKGRIIPAYVLEASAVARRGKPAWNRGISATWIKGDKSPFWKGGALKGYDIKMSSLEWRTLRSVVYKRDNWTCKDCGTKCHKGIQCHHIKPFRESKDDSLENLVTLCVSCHARRHSELNTIGRINVHTGLFQSV